MMPTPPEKFFKEAKSIISKFLWDDRKPKIAYQKLIQNTEKGGLKLIDLQAKEAALKCTWPVHAMKNDMATWKAIFELQIPIGLPDFFNCNLHYRDVYMLGLPDNSILESVCKAWFKIVEYEQELNEMHVDQTVICNSKIKINKRIILNNRMHKVGIEKIRDIYCVTDKKFFTFAEMQHKYGNIGNFLDHYSLVHTITDAIMVNDLVDEPEHIPILDIAASKTKTTKWAYDIYVRNNFRITDTARTQWNIELKADFSEEEWEKIRTHGHTISMSAKLKLFQFRVLSKRLTTNVQRHIWNKEVSPLCTFCNIRKETVHHLLISCQTSQKIWIALAKWLQYFFNIQTTLDEKTIILNKYKGQCAEMINKCILIAKQYIYAAKCRIHQLPRCIFR